MSPWRAPWAGVRSPLPRIGQVNPGSGHQRQRRQPERVHRGVEGLALAGDWGLEEVPEVEEKSTTDRCFLRGRSWATEVKRRIVLRPETISISVG